MRRILSLNVYGLSGKQSDFRVEQFWQNLEAGISTLGMQDPLWDLPEDAGRGHPSHAQAMSYEEDWRGGYGDPFIQQEIDEFFQLGIGATDARVEELADGSSGVLSGTKRTPQLCSSHCAR